MIEILLDTHINTFKLSKYLGERKGTLGRCGMLFSGIVVQQQLRQQRDRSGKKHACTHTLTHTIKKSWWLDSGMSECVCVRVFGCA